MTGLENLELVARLFGLDKRSVKRAATPAVAWTCGRPSATWWPKAPMCS